MISREQYLDDNNWLGSLYEVSLELGPTGDDALAHRALTRLWRNPALQGPWQDRSSFMEEADELRVSEDQVRMYGVLRVNEDISLGCMSHLVRIAGEYDWLDLSIPTGMLGVTFDVSYPLDLATNPWMSTLDKCLAEIAGDIFTVVPFRLALLGEEASGACTAAELTSEQCELGGYLVPDRLWSTLKPSRSASHLSPGLVYAPLRGPHITYGG